MTLRDLKRMGETGNGTMISEIEIERYSSVRVIASRILHEICLLIGELAIGGTKLTLNAR